VHLLHGAGVDLSASILETLGTHKLLELISGIGIKETLELAKELPRDVLEDWIKKRGISDALVLVPGLGPANAAALLRTLGTAKASAVLRTLSAEEVVLLMRDVKKMKLPRLNKKQLAKLEKPAAAKAKISAKHPKHSKPTAAKKGRVKSAHKSGS
jgi:Mg/Co/Ni transporter MgtE